MQKRRCIAADQRGRVTTSMANAISVLATINARKKVADQIHAAEARAHKAITGEDMDDSGKKNPAGLHGSGIRSLTEEKEEESIVKFYADVVKANDEERSVTGVVLEPETVDAQLDIYSEDVIQKAAENFLSKYNKATKLGLQHKKFNKRFELLQSFIAPSDFAMGNKIIKKGSWIMKVRVVDQTIWKMVKEGKIRGFSIGGKARVMQLKAA